LTVADALCVITIPPWFDGWLIKDVFCGVYTPSTSGTPTIELYNMTDSQQILSTNLTIDINEYNSFKATTPAVINASYDDLAVGDMIAVNCTTAGTGTKGLDVLMLIEKPVG